MSAFRKQPSSSAPRLVGVAGGGLNNATWAKNAGVARVGQKGEQRTAEVLSCLYSGVRAEAGPTVLHDLMLPMSRVVANVDHMVVTGRTVYLLDSKMWKTGRYWTVFGKTRRGMERIDWADKHTMELARAQIDGYLRRCGVFAQVPRPIIVVWGSGSIDPNLTFYRAKGARVVAGDRLAGLVSRWRKPADPKIVAALAALRSGSAPSSDPWPA